MVCTASVLPLEEDQMPSPATAILHSLRDTNLTVADPTEDIRERRVVGKAGEEIGTVDDLLIDERERKVRLLQVKAGGLLGLGETKFLVPVDAITRINDDTVYIDQTRERVVGAPRYDPALTREADWTDLYQHYGYRPFYGPDYVAPPFPYYP
jgi:sporulation protein YlmC with PRC-barrel domain